MKCPVCPDVTLAMTNREGIEIDYCPSCRGVWLDRGELDKIIERSAAEPPAARPGESYARAPQRPYEDGRRGDDDEHRRYDERYPHKRKRGGLLGDLFDFD